MLDISFIVPLYNQEKYIIPCLDSIINAGLPKNEYEIIVWNDGSTDKSEELILDYKQSKHYFVHWYKSRCFVFQKSSYFKSGRTIYLVCR